MKPERDHDWNNGRSVVVFLLVDWSCGPQFASVSPVRDSIGKWTYEASSELLSILNDIPLSIVPFRYLSMCLQWFRWPTDGLDRYLERILVAVEMSGLVEVDSHWKEPTRCWNSWVSAACC